MYGLPRDAWIGFAIWLAIGMVFYVSYGYRHSRLRRGLAPLTFEE